METIVALSRMESELISACEMTRIATWLIECLKELNYCSGEAIKVGIVNKSAKLCKTIYSSKHVDTKYHYIREMITAGSIQLFYQPTK